MTKNSNFAFEPLAALWQPRCPHCAALSRLTHSLIDTKHGQTVHVYQCVTCGKRIWDESPRSRARLQ